MTDPARNGGRNGMVFTISEAHRGRHRDQGVGQRQVSGDERVG